jgi:two-component system, LytTR family, sensor kinase
MIWFIIAALVLIIASLVYVMLQRRSRQRKQEDVILNQFRERADFSSREEMLWYAAREVISRLGFSDCVIYELDSEKEICIQVAACGPKSPRGNHIVNPIQIRYGKGIVGAVAVSGKPERIASTMQDPRYIADDNVRWSELTIPVLVNHRVVAILDSEESEANYFSQAHQNRMERVAEIIAEKWIVLIK